MTIPAPPARYKWPFRQWAVGDSGFFTEPTSRVQTAAHMVGSKNGWRFVTETRTEGGVTGVRVWRVA